jgi:hypothetical protein
MRRYRREQFLHTQRRSTEPSACSLLRTRTRSVELQNGHRGSATRIENVLDHGSAIAQYLTDARVQPALTLNDSPKLPGAELSGVEGPYGLLEPFN